MDNNIGLYGIPLLVPKDFGLYQVQLKHIIGVKLVMLLVGLLGMDLMDHIHGNLKCFVNHYPKLWVGNSYQ